MVPNHVFDNKVVGLFNLYLKISNYEKNLNYYRCKMLSLQEDKELFESMRKIVVLNSLAFSYPLSVLMRVFYK